MPARDYYDILGVSRTANDDEIKQAYRRLVRKYHPDVSKKKNTLETFKEIQEAYEVLSDKKKRAAYDQFGHAGVGMGAGAAGASSERWAYGPGGARVHTWSNFNQPGGVGFDLGDIFSEVLGRRTAGADPFGPRSGSRVRPRRERGRDVEHNVTLTFEQAVWGTRMRIQLQQGDGQDMANKQTIEVKIPPGVAEGSRIRVRGKGDPGPHGGQPGHLYIVVHVKPHAHFRREGNDIHLTVPITMVEAMRGAKITLPTIDGPTVVTVPPGTNGGQKLRLKGKGAPDPKTGQRGDQYATIRLIVPKQTPSGIDETLDKLNDACGDPRADLGWAV